MLYRMMHLAGSPHIPFFSFSSSSSSIAGGAFFLSDVAVFDSTFGVVAGVVSFPCSHEKLTFDTVS